MLSLQGQFTFTADQPQLHCAAFFISEPEEFITIYYDLVSIDCQGGDFLKVSCPHRAAPTESGGPGRAQRPAWGSKLGERVVLLRRRSAGAPVGEACSVTPMRQEPPLNSETWPTPGRAGGPDVVVVLNPPCALLGWSGQMEMDKLAHVLRSTKREGTDGRRLHQADLSLLVPAGPSLCADVPGS